jgi:acyl-CoA synthetase (AMP-forming)/AMP-acid ligase II
MNIIDILHLQEKERPDQAAIIDVYHGAARTTTFSQLVELVEKTATLLDESGLKPGDSVLVFQPMSLELYTALLALFHLKLTAMFLDPSAGKKHIEQCCAIGAPKALIASKKAHLLRLVSPALRHIPYKFAVGFGAWKSITNLERYEDPCDAVADTPALLTFTSGSTGEPKAALRTHGFLLAQHKALEDALELTLGSTDLATLPIFILANLASGMTSVIPDADLRAPSKVDAGPIVAQIQKYAPQTIGASPAFMERICDYCSQTNTSLSSIKKVFTGGAPVLPALLDRLKLAAPRADIVAVYGSTEAEPIAHLSLSEISDEDRLRMQNGAGLLAGFTVNSVQLRILKSTWGEQIGPYSQSEFERQFCMSDEPGEIVVAGDHVLRGYLHGRGDNETKFHVVAEQDEIWHRTGDAGYLDNAGRVWLLGRCSAKIEDDGGALYPFAVETAIHDTKGLVRSAAVSHGGKRLLVLEPTAGAKLDLASLAARTEWAKLDSICVVKKIPVDRRHNAKIDYPTLKQMLDKRNQS